MVLGLELRFYIPWDVCLSVFVAIVFVSGTTFVEFISSFRETFFLNFLTRMKATMIHPAITASVK